MESIHVILFKKTIFCKSKISLASLIGPPKSGNQGVSGGGDDAFRCLAALPLRAKNQVIGVVHLYAPEARGYGREDQALLRRLADQAAMAIAHARLFADTERRAQELHGLYEVAQVVSEMSNLDSALAQIVERVSSILTVEKCWLMFLDASRRELVAQTAAVGAVEEQLLALRRPLDAAGITTDIFHCSRPYYTNDAAAETPVLNEFGAIFRLRNLMGVPLRAGEETLGVFFAANKRGGGRFTGNDVRLFKTLASDATVLIQNANLYDRLRRSYFSLIQVVSAMVDTRELQAAGHSRRVAMIAEGVARALALPPEQVEAIRVAGWLHDIGKIGVSERILLKPGKLTPHEYVTIKRHPRFGASLLAEVEFPWDVLAVIRHHHERFDGKGYPDGLREGDIPLGARILAVADAFEVMTSHRPYRRARSDRTALAEIRAQAGSQFDPEIVAPFARAWEAGDIPGAEGGREGR